MAATTSSDSNAAYASIRTTVAILVTKPAAAKSRVRQLSTARYSKAMPPMRNSNASGSVNVSRLT
jgi:hypothetical protein